MQQQFTRNFVGNHTRRSYFGHIQWDDSDIAYSPIYCNSAHHVVRVCSILYVELQKATV